MPNRRTFLKGLGALGAAASLPLGRSAFANNTCSYKILEIFAHGAINHRETLWLDGGPGPSEAAPDRVDPGEMGLPGPHQATAFMEESSIEGLGHDIYLGGGLAPLASMGWHHDMRLIAMTTPAPDAHTLGASVALTGNVIGNPTAIGLGARIQHNEGAQSTPASWVIDCGSHPRIANMAAATGALPAWARPFVFKMGTNIVERLDRSNKDHIDQLLEVYRSRYADRLEGLRAPDFASYSASTAGLYDWDAIRNMLPSEELISGSPLGVENRPIVRAVPVATHLLDQGARHVCLVGRRNDMDTHSGFGATDTEANDLLGHARHHNTWMWYLTRALTQSGIDLSNTLVVIHSEFGRYLDGNNGSEHWRKGFPALAFGGPISGRGLAGRLDFQDDPRGAAVNPVLPHELLNALSTAAGLPSSAVDEVSAAGNAAKVLGTTCQLSLSDI